MHLINSCTIPNPARVSAPISAHIFDRRIDLKPGSELLALSPGGICRTRSRRTSTDRRLQRRAERTHRIDEVLGSPVSANTLLNDAIDAIGILMHPIEA